MTRLRQTALAAAFVVLTPVLGWAEETWRTFTYPELHAAIDFPGEPQKQTRSVDSPKGGQVQMVVLTASVDGDGALAMTAANTPPPNGNVDDALDRVVGGAASQPGEVLVSSAKITVNGQSGRDYVMRDDSKGITLRGRIVATPDWFYQALALSHTDHPYPGAERFVTSLKLLPPN